MFQDRYFHSLPGLDVLLLDGWVDTEGCAMLESLQSLCLCFRIHNAREGALALASH